MSEFQRRLWLGTEAAELGPGGVAVVAKATGVAEDTVWARSVDKRQISRNSREKSTRRTTVATISRTARNDATRLEIR